MMIALKQFTTYLMHYPSKNVLSGLIKIMFNIFSDLECFNINESELQQSIDPWHNKYIGGSYCNFDSNFAYL